MKGLLALALLVLGGLSFLALGRGASPAATEATQAAAPHSMKADEPLVVDDFACLDQNGAFQRLSRHGDASFLVLYVYANACPIVRQNASELVALAAAMRERKVRFLCIDPAPQDTRAAVAAEAAGLGLDLPILLDDTQCVAEMLGLTRTGEALVVSTAAPEWRVRWRGPIDDRAGYGAQKAAATRAYLREALEALLAGQAPPDDAPASKGCALTLLEPRASDAIDYAREVVPILKARCQTCHRAGGIGPWAMDGYAHVRGWSAMMREVLLQQRMPPGLADPLHGSFMGMPHLLPDELRTLVHWIEAGAPRGEGPDPLAEPLPALEEWPLGPPDLVVDLPEQQIDATGVMPYLKPTVTVELAGEHWVRAVDLHPSNRAVMHHGFAFLGDVQELDVIEDVLSQQSVADGERFREWRAGGGKLEELPPEVRLPRNVERQGLSTYFAKYAPGQLPDVFPAGTGKRLPPNPSFAFQLHYQTNGTATTDRPRLGIYFNERPPERELKVTSAKRMDLTIAPGARAYRASAARRFNEDVVLYELAPHMHYRGRSMRFTAFPPDGSEHVLLSVPEYEFDWQMTYTLKTPIHLPAGTRVVCDAVFDNSATNERNPDWTKLVRWGKSSQDEMLIGYFVYTVE